VCPEILRWPEETKFHLDSGLVVEPSTHLRILRVSNTWESAVRPRISGKLVW
jgi:hypothetical protein